jgi:hypothetical protein
MKTIKDTRNFNHPSIGKCFEFIGDITSTFWVKGLKMRVEWIDEKGNYCCMPIPSIGNCLSCGNRSDQFKTISEYDENELINWPKNEPGDKVEYERRFVKISTSEFLRKYSKQK